ncbi:MAG: YgiQ family radical SAM protein [Lamprobacter sp.]|uniref:YgiQ family radical SAM protein n=1 Tax=Lamprobacter sp. TaxID=3100796 RepID=UPI002B25DD8C|nr:YgiQ family radical SAM protein [Lamprobacter sp.]MEA3639665.1 YgiQ family radical SAM protein [Lamprobacter sp.]
MQQAPDLFSYRKHWAHKLGTAPELPMTRAEMDLLGWDSCDIIIVTGDAYVDHPSFGMAIIGRLLEAQGFRVGILSQPDWTSAEPFRALGRPELFFGITAGNMDSMVNRYTSDRRRRSDDAYSPDGAGGRRPDRSVTVYAQRAREAFHGVPIVIGGIEASLRRIAHFDYWSDRVRRSVLADAKADLLLFGNAERAIVELAHRLARGEAIVSIRDIRGTAFMRRGLPEGWTEIDASELDKPGPVRPHLNPYETPDWPVEPAAGSGDSGPYVHGRQPTCADAPAETRSKVQTAAKAGIETIAHAAVQRGAKLTTQVAAGTSANTSAKTSANTNANTNSQAVSIDQLRRRPGRERSVVRLPSFEQVRDDSVLYAHASRVFHLETNPGNARALVQRHGEREVWLNPPPIPLSSAELDRVFALPYSRRPHSEYGQARLPAWEMIRNSISIMRGCFGGCTFCSITEHEGRIIQSRSEESILEEIAEVRDRTPEFTGIISDLGGPTANMWRLACKDARIEAACRRLSCVYPSICANLNTDHGPLIQLYRKARAVPGIKRVLIASGLRYDLALRSPEYIRELVMHHVGGYLKIAPEHTEPGPLAAMMKPGIGSYERFRQLFERYSREAGKEQYLIPYFIAAHPGTSDEDMLNLALWLKRNRLRPDQVQAFLPTPLALASTMYHSGINPLRRVRRDAKPISVVRKLRQRRLHKAFLRWHDPANWPALREALKSMGRADLIGNSKHHLVPACQARSAGGPTPRGRRRSMKPR